MSWKPFFVPLSLHLTVVGFYCYGAFMHLHNASGTVAGQALYFSLSQQAAVIHQACATAVATECDLAIVK